MKNHILFTVLLLTFLLCVGLCPVGVFADTLQPISHQDATLVDTSLSTSASPLLRGNLSPVAVASASSTYTLSKANTDGSFTTISSHATYSEALSAMNASSEKDAVVIQLSSNKVVAMKRGMSILIGSSTVTLTNLTFGSQYNVSIRTNVPMFYLYSQDASGDVAYVRTRISGVTFRCKIGNVLLIPDAHMQHRATGSQASKKFNMDYYSIEDGDLIHHLYYYTPSSKSMYTASFTVDKAPSFMAAGKKYYSYDGHTFYKNYYEPSEGGTAVGTYYPYFKYLSYRSKSSYTASDLNRYMKANYPSSSILLNSGSAFISAQNTYGANALLELAFAHLESGRGTSTIATTKNNLFGISAYDSNPDAADAFSSVTECILYHAKKYINEGYADAYAYIDSSKGTKYYDVSDRSVGWVSSYSGDWRYMGAYPGNKAGGVNFMYATDPYHGEKIGGLAYEIDKYLGSKDYGRYTIALTTKTTMAYAKASTSSWTLYKYAGRNYRGDQPTGMAMVILGESGNFYRVQAEMPVNSDQRACMVWSYNFSTSVAYVPKSSVKIIRSSSQESLDLDAAEELISTVQALDTSIYTPETAGELKDAYQALLTVMSSVNATQEQIDEAVMDLRLAYNALVPTTPAIPVSSITVNGGASKTVHTLEPFTLKYSILPADASVQKVNFTTSDPAIATVSSSGTVTPLANGTVQISVQAIDGSGAEAVLTLTIDTPTITSSVYTVDQNNAVLKGVPVLTNSTTLLSNVSCGSGMQMELADKNGTPLSGETLLKSGMYLKLYNADGKLVQNLQISLKGDLNGDGSVNIADMTVLRSVLLEKTSLSGAFLASADLNGDGKVSIVDFTSLKSTILNQ